MAPTALITGASQGSGRATALRFAREGYDLVLAARQRDRLDAVAEEVRQLGREAIAVATDVGDPEQVRSLVRTALDFRPIDVLVNNAGICLTGAVQHTRLDDWQQILQTNLFGYIHTIHELVPHFLERQQGAIVNVGSFGGKMPLPNMSAYCTSKYAVTGLTQTLRLELAPQNIHVSLVHPGVINSSFLERAAFRGKTDDEAASQRAQMAEMLRSQWVSQPEDIAQAIWEAVRDDKPEIVVGAAAIATEAYRFLPGVVGWAMQSSL